MDYGVICIFECWQDNVEKGYIIDFFGVVDCWEDEVVVFLWIEWLDKVLCKVMEVCMEEIMKIDDCFNLEKNLMLFDGVWMIYGGFEFVVEEGMIIVNFYVQGFIVLVFEGNKVEYCKVVFVMWEIMKDYGVKWLIEVWQDDVLIGKQIDFFCLVKVEFGEIVVFLFIEWILCEVCDGVYEKMMVDEWMQQFMGDNFEVKFLFDGKCMVYGGFCLVVELICDVVEV